MIEVAAFRSQVRRSRLQWQAGLILKSVFMALCFALILLLCYAVADYTFAFASETRANLNIALLGISGGYLLWLVASSALRSDLQMAQRADRLSETRRDTVFTALQLSKTVGASGTGLEQFLIARAVADGTNALRGLKKRQVFPADEVYNALFAMLGVVAVLTLLGGIAWPVAKVVFPRIVYPSLDIPPYSRLQFVVTPEQPNVDYGGNILISTEISGGQLDQPVYLVTRDQSGTHESRCFSESSSKFVQRLERVIRPLEFSFRSGNARSKWHPVEVLLEPRVTKATATVIPPEYSGLPTQNFVPGNDPLNVIPGSKIELTLTSNRPLRGGRLQLLDLETEVERSSEIGQMRGTHELTYTWVAKRDAYLRAHLTDVRGTSMKEPLQWLQKMKPDAAPEATISEPAEFVLATPSVVVPLKGSASDDLGLRRVDLVKSIVGYRDRFDSAEIVSGDPVFEFSSELPLKDIGVEPGQVIEIYLEAADHNPSLTGVTSSSISRVEIISEEDYAEMLRVRTTVAEFSERYRLMDAKLSEMIEALKAIEQRAHLEKRDGIEEIFDLARDKNIEVLEIYEKMAIDFAAFDLEKGLIAQAGETAVLLRAQQLQITQLSIVDPHLEEKARAMLDALGEHKRELVAEREEAEKVSRIAELMELAARYEALIRDQEAVVRRLAPFEKLAGDGEDAAKLQVLGAEERRIRARLSEVKKSLIEKAKGLEDETEAEFRQHAEAFAERIDHYQIESDLKQARETAEQGEGSQALASARMALEKMRRVIEDTSPDGFGALCQGECKAGLGEMPGLKETLEQMLSAIRGRFGGRGTGSDQGNGSGQGVGVGGTGVGGSDESGSLMGGHSPLNVPVFGPDRLQLSPPPGSTSSDGPAKAGRGTGPNADAVETNLLPGGANSVPLDAETLPTEKIPPKYRDAVKRYFQPKSNDSNP
ncbi:MAG: hypothetical protein KDN22_18105 [Verrucomicrobiae bacterium]|nr:hypothetical protein [Verrucomicrobiae bacterium]